jgi:hypothetical protein
MRALFKGDNIMKKLMTVVMVALFPVLVFAQNGNICDNKGSTMDGHGYGMMSRFGITSGWGLFFCSFLCLILVSIVFSVIFWLVHNWLVKNNKK